MVQLEGTLRLQFPHLLAVLLEEREFIELRVKARDDGTTLSIVKKYGPDGKPIVCFGVGYGVVGSLLGIDASINAGAWKNDRPWVRDKPVQ